MPTPRSHRRARLRVECLEDRSLPSSTPILTETFQTPAANGLPTGWVQWSSNQSGAFQIDRTAGLGDSGELTAAVSSGVTARSWIVGTKLTDVEVSAAVYLNSMNPAVIYARGKNLDSTTPTYYAVSITRGLSVELTRVVAGKSTTLSTDRSADYVSNQWVQVVLRVAGNALTVQVRRMDTGRYLSSSGDWVSQPVNALTASDTAIASEGQVGVGRGTVGNDRLIFDSVRVQQVQPETRELLQAERFDSAAPGKLPDGWSQWSNRPEGSAQVGGDESLKLNGITTSSTRAWLNRSMPADLQVSSSLFVDSLVPALFMVRGQNLGGATASYYAVSISRGLTIDLVKVVNGQQTLLGQIKSKDYISGQWLQVSLVAKGTELRVQVFRTDTSQYLRSDGTWGLTAGWALARTDSSLRSGGFAGIGRGTGYSGALSFDNFIVSSAPARWDEGNPIPTKEDKPTNTPTPPSDSVPNTPLPPPPTTTPTTPPVTNPSLPTVPRNLDWIRVAQLAYYGTPMTDYEKALLRDYVDLVIPNLQYLETISQVSPTTPNFIYTNVSNIYLSLLTDWLAFADRNKYDRESAFFHVTKPTSYSGLSASAVQVNQFWGVYRGSDTGGWTDLTYASKNTNSTIGLAPAGGSLAIGYTEKYREINVTLKTASSGGWAGKLEYVTAVDSQGRPTAWAPLTLLRDGTNGFRNSGTITFDPPKNWVAASINGSDRLFYVRERTTSTSGVAPVLSALSGRDYTNSRGGTTGTIPVFDTAADLDKDGYLNDAEYAKRKAGMDARFVYESRLFYPNYGPNRFATNVASTAFRAWAVDYHVRFLKATPLADGFFVDNSIGRIAVDPAAVKESMGNYAADYGSLLGAMNKQLATTGKWLIANTAGGGNSANPIIQNGVSFLEEFALRPMAANFIQFEDLAATLKNRRALSGGKAYEILDSLPTNGSPTDPRMQLATLAMYYLLADPNLSFLMMNGGGEPATSWTRHFTDAIKFNVGKPKADQYVFATGKDPSNSSLDYKVFARQYTNALVLYKPLSYTKGTNGTLADNTATTFALGGTYRVVNANGTLGPPITRITLRNGEGAILARA